MSKCNGNRQYVQTMKNIGKDFAIPIRTRRMYAVMADRDAKEFDYLGRVGSTMTAVERAKQLIFFAVESTAVKNYDPLMTDMGIHTIY